MDKTEHLLAKIGQYGLIVNAEQKVLILERVRSKCWTFPGGRLNEGEEWNEALIREIREETNLEVFSFKIFGNNITRDDYQTKYCIYFEIQPQNTSELKISSEHSNFKWIDFTEMRTINFEDGIEEILHNYFYTHSLKR